MKLLIHIVTHHRPDLLKKCLESVLPTLDEDTEVHIVLNGADAETRSYLQGLVNSKVFWTEVEKESLSASRNRGLATQGYDIIHYLDDDVTVPPDLFRLVRAQFHSDPSLAILGGPNLTPPDSSFLERVFGATMTSPFCAPGVHRRYGGGDIRLIENSSDAFIFCNLAIRASLIPRSLRFKTELSSNQENLFLYEALAAGLRAKFIKEARVYHRRRNSWARFWKQISSYGSGRWEQSLASPASLSFRFFLPSLVVILAAVSLWFPLGLRSVMALLTIHLCLGFFSGYFFSKEARRLPILGLALIPVTTLVTHVAYGCGFWWAMGRSFKVWFTSSYLFPVLPQKFAK